MKKRKQLGVDITPNFIDHFGHTVAKFRQAARTMEKSGETVTFQFEDVPDVDVTILGKLGP